MRRARRNPGDLPATRPQVADTLNLNPNEVELGAREFQKWHWGEFATKVVDGNDPDMPRILVECGRLVRLQVRAPRARSGGRHPRRDRDAMIELSHRASENSHVAYDPNHPYERLYLLLDKSIRVPLKQRFWDENSARALGLNQLASVAGGRHAKQADYPDIRVKPIGVLTAVVYRTTKKGDGLSYYIHQKGELSGWLPILAVDEQGRLWIAGGNYTSPEPGITD